MEPALNLLNRIFVRYNRSSVIPSVAEKLYFVFL